MKKQFILKAAWLSIFALATISACNDDDEIVNPDLPVIITADITDIETNVARSGGNVTAQGFDTVTSRGLCWSTSPNPTTADNKLTNGSGLGTFSGSMIGLNPGTTYYVRAFAINSKGTGYGAQKTFSTKIIPAGQSFSANINSAAWAANSDDIYTRVSGGVLSIRADHPSNGSYFGLPIKYFYGTDTTINFPLSLSLTLYNPGYITGSTTYVPINGSMYITKSVSGGIETFNGTFSGTWKDPISPASVSMTNGQFVAKRAL